MRASAEWSPPITWSCSRWAATSPGSSRSFPTPPDATRALAEQTKARGAAAVEEGAEFDKAYLQHEIAFHQSVLNAIKGTLLPAIKNDELRTLMKSVLPGFEHISPRRRPLPGRGA